MLSTLSVIRTDATHFNYALMGLDEETIELVTDVLKDCSYARFNGAALRRLSLNEEAKMNPLLNKLILGYRTLSQMLREMRQLGGNGCGDFQRAPAVTWPAQVRSRWRCCPTPPLKSTRCTRALWPRKYLGTHNKKSMTLNKRWLHWRP